MDQEYQPRVEEKQYNSPPIAGQSGLILKYKIKEGESPEGALFYLVHGRAGNYDVMWTFGRCIPTGSTIITPEALFHDPVQPHSPNGKSWWAPTSESGIIKDSADAAESISQFINQVESRHLLTPSKRYAIGFSQGAAVLSSLFQSQTSLFNGVCLLAGFVVESEKTIAGELPDILVIHGKRDTIVPIDKAEKGVKYLKDRGFKVDFQVDDVGHKVGAPGMRLISDWFLKRI